MATVCSSGSEDCCTSPFARTRPSTWARNSTTPVSTGSSRHQLCGPEAVSRRQSDVYQRRQRVLRDDRQDARADCTSRGQGSAEHRRKSRAPSVLQQQGTRRVHLPVAGRRLHSGSGRCTGDGVRPGRRTGWSFSGRHHSLRDGVSRARQEDPHSQPQEGRQHVLLQLLAEDIGCSSDHPTCRVPGQRA